MEEKKSNLSVVSTTEESVEDLKKKNDQLTNYCNQLLQQRNQLANQMNTVQNILNKLPWLFKVVELKDNFTEEFVKNTVLEIETIMTPPVEEDTDTDSND